MCDLLNESNSTILLSRLRDLSDINNVVLIDIFNDIFDLVGYPFNSFLFSLVFLTICTVEGVKKINVQLSPPKREVLRGLYEYYKKEHKYHGQA